MRQVKWGILGAGHIANKFAADFAVCKNAVLLAVASSSLDKAMLFAQKHNIPHAFGRYQDLFSLDLDVVYIATPHSFHAEHSLLCLKNKVGVLCEKPFAMNAEEVELMINTARANNVFLMEAMWTRFLPAILKVKEIIDQGLIGDINLIEADFGFTAIFDPKSRLFDLKLGGGALLDIGIYPAFLAFFILGQPIEILASSIFSETGVDISTAFIYKYKQAQAVLNCSLETISKCEAQICGTKGKIILNARFHETKKLTLVLNKENPQVFDFERETFGYNFEIDEVNSCIANNETESKLLPLDFSLAFMQLLDKTREKAGIA